MSEGAMSRIKKFEELTNLIADILEETKLDVKVTTGVTNSVEYYNKNQMFVSLSPGHSSGIHLSFKMPIDTAQKIAKEHGFDKIIESLDQNFVYTPEEMYENAELIKKFFLLAYGYCKDRSLS